MNIKYKDRKMKNKKKNQQASESKMTRRDFLGAASTTAAAFMIVPRHVIGGPGFVPPSDKLNIACIGVGGKGRSDTTSVSTENLVAFCDVDDKQMAKFVRHAKKNSKNHPQLLPMFEKAPKYRDFRKMLEKEKSIDAVTISTPSILKNNL